MLCPTGTPTWRRSSTAPSGPASAPPSGPYAPRPPYEDALRAAVDLGGDTDTVAAVTGGLAGAV
ncbi:ADP-ribosylglycohydrolase family protein [Streptomyces sp. L7]